MKALTRVSLALLFALGACKSDGGEQWLSAGSEEESGDEGSNPEVGCESEELGAPVLRRLTRVELRDSLVDVFPELGAWDDSSMGPDPVSERGFSNDAELLTVGDQTAAEILATAEDVASLLTADGTLGNLLPCSQDAADSACAQSFIEARGLRLFHRPLSADEVASYVALFEEVASSSDFATGLRWTLVALINSPNFIYRFELGAEGSSGERALLPWEVATALAYTYSGVGPSNDLLSRAADGEFDTAQGRVAAAQELLAGGSHGEAILGRFFGEWIRYGRAASKVKNDVPEYEAVRDDLVEETRAYIDRVVRVEGGGMRELLTTPTTELNAELAAYYGWGTASGTSFETQERPEEWAVGLLAQGSVLAGNAHTDSTSPTLRGLLIFEKLLCNPGLTPPPDVPSIDPPAPGEMTTRERYEIAHAGEDACAACHQFFDPLGFASEHFDRAGRYRPDESGLTIDASGTVPLISGNEISFDGLTQLAFALSDDVSVHRCAGDNVERFAFGGEVDGCRDVQLREALVAGEVGLADYFVQLAGADGFARRDDAN